MLNAKAFANAATVITAVFYIACLVLSYIAPSFLFGIAESWIHSLNLNVLETTISVSFGMAVWGLITICILTWVTTYATIFLYNSWVKK